MSLAFIGYTEPFTHIPFSVHHVPENIGHSLMTSWVPNICNKASHKYPCKREHSWQLLASEGNVFTDYSCRANGCKHSGRWRPMAKKKGVQYGGESQWAPLWCTPVLITELKKPTWRNKRSNVWKQTLWKYVQPYNYLCDSQWWAERWLLICRSICCWKLLMLKLRSNLWVDELQMKKRNSQFTCRAYTYYAHSLIKPT